MQFLSLVFSALVASAIAQPAAAPPQTVTISLYQTKLCTGEHTAPQVLQAADACYTDETPGFKPQSVQAVRAAGKGTCKLYKYSQAGCKGSVEVAIFSKDGTFCEPYAPDTPSNVASFKYVC